MVFPDPYPPPPPQALLPFPDPPKEGDSMAQWAQATGYAQPDNVGGVYLDFDSLDALFAWEQGGIPEPIPDSQPGHDLSLNWARDMPGNAAALDYFDEAPSAATTSVPVSPSLPTNIYLEDFLVDLPEWDPASFTPALTEVSSVTSPQSDNSTGDQLLPSPTYEAAASQFVPILTAPLPNFDFANTFLPDHATCNAPSWSIEEDISLGGQVEPDYGSLFDPMSISGNTHIADIPGMATQVDVSSTTESASREGVGAPETVLGKRSRESSSYELPQKKGKPTTDGVLKAAGSRKRTPRTPAVRTQTKANCKSKAVGRGAGRLASTTAQGLYNRSLLGPSVPQGSVGALAQGKPSWTEEREQEGTRHDTGSTLPQRSARRDPAIPEDLEAIPKTLTAWQLLLLQTTQADLERGAVRVIKCRLCPTERFKTWASFSRHCKDCEQHPAQVQYCEQCGIYFGRQDSMKRHYESATKACCDTPPAKAAWRKYKANQLLTTFHARVEYCQRTGEELDSNFAEMAMEELPSGSKKPPRKRKSKGTARP